MGHLKGWCRCGNSADKKSEYMPRLQSLEVPSARHGSSTKLLDNLLFANVRIQSFVPEEYLKN